MFSGFSQISLSCFLILSYVSSSSSVTEGVSTLNHSVHSQTSTHIDVVDIGVDDGDGLEVVGVVAVISDVVIVVGRVGGCDGLDVPGVGVELGGDGFPEVELNTVVFSVVNVVDTRGLVVWVVVDGDGVGMHVLLIRITVSFKQIA